jgi:hypothetical protein
MIRLIQSLHAVGVISDHTARALGAAASAFRRLAGTLDSNLRAEGLVSSVTTSPVSTPAVTNHGPSQAELACHPAGRARAGQTGIQPAQAGHRATDVIRWYETAPPKITIANSTRIHTRFQLDVAKATAIVANPVTAPAILNASANLSRRARCVDSPEFATMGLSARNERPSAQAGGHDDGDPRSPDRKLDTANLDRQLHHSPEKLQQGYDAEDDSSDNNISALHSAVPPEVP